MKIFIALLIINLNTIISENFKIIKSILHQKNLFSTSGGNFEQI